MMIDDCASRIVQSISVADRAAVSETAEEIARSFRDAFSILDRRIRLFLALALSALASLAMQRELDRIGEQ